MKKRGATEATPRLIATVIDQSCQQVPCGHEANQYSPLRTSRASLVLIAMYTRSFTSAEIMLT